MIIENNKRYYLKNRTISGVMNIIEWHPCSNFIGCFHDGMYYYTPNGLKYVRENDDHNVDWNNPLNKGI